MKEKKEKRPVAIVTGASMGIGEALAERFASRFYDVALVARTGGTLEGIAARLTSRYGVQTLVVVEDLADPQSAERVAAAVFGAFGGVDLLVNNAGFGLHSDFDQSEGNEMLRMIQVNVGSLVDLTHRCLPSILERRGGVINIASNAAFQPVPHMAVYGATKAFVLSFSEALHMELKSKGVRVLAVCPGATKTNFFAVAGESAQVGAARTVDDVVKTTIEAYDKGEMTVIDGPANRLLAFFPRLLPRSTIASVSASMMKN